MNKQNKHHQSAKHSKNSAAKRIIIGIIIALSIVVLAVTIYSLIFTNERRIKSLIPDLATDYYENYFYENLVSSNEKPGHLEETMEKYRETGLTPVTLNDLLLYDYQKNSQYYDYLTSYCNENHTQVTFYPDPPYGRTDYHTEYTYSCNF